MPEEREEGNDALLKRFLANGLELHDLSIAVPSYSAFTFSRCDGWQPLHICCGRPLFVRDLTHTQKRVGNSASRLRQMHCALRSSLLLSRPFSFASGALLVVVLVVVSASSFTPTTSNSFFLQPLSLLPFPNPVTSHGVPRARAKFHSSFCFVFS